MFEVKIYIETSLKGPGTREGWYAAVAEYQTKKHGIETREDFELKKMTTYHKSVLSALLKSLKRLNAACILEIHTDSSYLSNNYKNGNLKRWKNNGWKNIKGEDIKNKELWQQVSVELDKHKSEIIREKRNAYTSWMQEQAKERFKTQENAEKTECEGDFDDT